MKVFISWSGDQSKGVADTIRKWLPGVLQAVRPYFSPDDVAKGSRWGTEISKELEASKIGLLILTPSNIQAPWLLFEAGALAKNLEKSKVCPLLFGLEPTDVSGPIVQFQSAKFEKPEMHRVVKMINSELGDGGLASDVLDQVFDMWWPKLEADISKHLKESSSEPEDYRTDRDLLEEVLTISRSISRLQSRDLDRNGRSRVTESAIVDLAVNFTRIVERVLRIGDPELMSLCEAHLRPLMFISSRNVPRSSRLMAELREAELLLARGRHVPFPPSEVDEEDEGDNEEIPH
jgi:hypothetical protein